MGLFKKKSKEKPRFGQNLEVSCSYCRFNAASGEETICTVNSQIKNGKCKKYIYNPLMRMPRPAPELKTDFTEDDFKL